MKKYTGIIYMYESPSGKYYIGQTTRPKSRKNEIGKKLSEETKRKISKSCTGKICKGRSCIKLSIDNVELAEYSRIIDAAKDNNISQSAISMAISGKKKTAGGYKWKYKEEF